MPSVSEQGDTVWHTVEQDSAEVSNGGNYDHLRFNQEHDVGFHFDGIGITQGAIISSATLGFYLYRLRSTPVTPLFYPADTNNASIWSSNYGPRNIAKGSNSTNTALTGPSAFESRTQVAVTSLIQEVISRTGWSSQNNINIGGFNDLLTRNYQELSIDQYGHNPSNAATLDITYSAGTTTLTVSVPTETLTASYLGPSIDSPTSVQSTTDELTADGPSPSIDTSPATVDLPVQTLNLKDPESTVSGPAAVSSPTEPLTVVEQLTTVSTPTTVSTKADKMTLSDSMPSINASSANVSPNAEAIPLTELEPTIDATTSAEISADTLILTDLEPAVNTSAIPITVGLPVETVTLSDVEPSTTASQATIAPTVELMSVTDPGPEVNVVATISTSLDSIFVAAPLPNIEATTNVGPSADSFSVTDHEPTISTAPVVVSSPVEQLSIDDVLGEINSPTIVGLAGDALNLIVTELTITAPTSINSQAGQLTVSILNHSILLSSTRRTSRTGINNVQVLSNSDNEVEILSQNRNDVQVLSNSDNEVE